MVDPEAPATAIGCDLYRAGQLWASAATRWPFPLGPHISEMSQDLTPMRGHAAARYQVRLFGPWEEIVPGWPSGRVRLDINGMPGMVHPITFYTAEPTDWASGLARFLMPDPYAHSEYEFGDMRRVDTVWTLALRRFA